MKARLLKEFRLIALPASFAAACAVLTLAQWMAGDHSRTTTLELGRMISAMAAPAFLLGIVLLATFSFGTEFQQRTFLLLLSQPGKRFQIWGEKMLVTAGTVAALCLLESVTIGTTDLLQPADAPPRALLLIFLFAVVCSSAYWTLMARSTIGGAAFTLMGIFILGMGTFFVFEKSLSTGGDVPTGVLVGAKLNLFYWTLGITGMIYSFIFLWLGWRKFQRLELRDILGGDEIALPEALPGTKVVAHLLRAQPRGVFANLFRKELRLQKATFLAAAVFTACWLLTLLSSFLQPARQSMFEAIFNVCACFYLPLVAILAGSISLGEEKGLGINVWHLTLPPSARQQWFIKLSAGAITVCLLGIFLPALLAFVASMQIKLGLVSMLRQPEIWRFILIPLGLLMVLSFWAATLTGNTVRAALLVVFFFVAWGTASVPLQWISSHLGGLQRSLFRSHAIRSGLSPDSIYPFLSWEKFFWAVLAVLLLIALILGFRNFRRALAQEGFSWKQPIALLGTMLLFIFWITDLQMSAHYAARRLAFDLQQALQPLGQASFPSAGKKRELTTDELAALNISSPEIRRWLKGARIEIFQNETARPRSMNGFAIAIVQFANDTNAFHLNVTALPAAPDQPRAEE